MNMLLVLKMKFLRYIRSVIKEDGEAQMLRDQASNPERQDSVFKSEAV